MVVLRLLACRCLAPALYALALPLIALGASPASSGAQSPAAAFIQTHCVDCHAGASAEGGLDLTALGSNLFDETVQQRWIRIVDRVRDGEMPPPDAARLDGHRKDQFIRTTGDWIRAFQRLRDAELGRVRGRRLTRREVERSLHDLLGIDIPLADQLPAESTSAEFSTIATGQSMSHFQLERHLAAVDAALDEAFRRALGPVDTYQRDFKAPEIARRPERTRTREPEIIDGRAVVWSGSVIYYGRVPATTAPESGWYRFTITASGLKLPETGGVWTTVQSGPCVSSAPLLTWVGAFEATEQPREFTFETWLPQGHMLEIRPGDITLKRGKFAGGQIENGEGAPQDVPGIALDRITMERIHRGPGAEGIRRLLFGHVGLHPPADAAQLQQPATSAGRADAQVLLAGLARRAFRRPVTDEHLSGYVAMVTSALDAGEDFAAALRTGYRAILCSPRFLYFTETPGSLDDYAIATRLSYFLTGSMPDATLSQLAEQGRLKDAAVLREQAERLLAGASGRRFLEDFSAEWLDLDQIDFTEPDRRLYPEFDAIVKHSMLAETHAFLETLLSGNLSVSHLIAADFTFLNSRLARFYDIPTNTGDALERVRLAGGHRRGGVLTQGAILKVTANGTNTSPVVRGAWVAERLLGEDIPPPPDNVPAIEPDIRGAKTIREILAKHREQDSCASCHVKIDPAGFALENYDPAGQWRERYLQLVAGSRDRGPKIDPSYELPSGEKFSGIEEFQAIMSARPEKLARCLAKKLLVYGTGAPLSFADREALEQIVEHSRGENHGFRSIVLAVVTSPVFLSK